MVDLVKIRKKKADKKKEEGGHQVAETAPATADSTPRQPDQPVAEQPTPAASVQLGSPEAVQSESQALPATKLEKFKAQAGKRRETAENAFVTEAAGVYIELLTFLIAREQYAIDIERIIEIVTPRPVTRIPNADPTVVGIMSLRGTIVTLVDVRRKLRHAESADEVADTRIVVIDHNNEMIGFIVDRVLRVVKVTSANVEPHPVVHATELDESIRGVFRVGGALTILLDLDKLLDSRALATTA